MTAGFLVTALMVLAEAGPLVPPQWIEPGELVLRFGVETPAVFVEGQTGADRFRVSLDATLPQLQRQLDDLHDTLSSPAGATDVEARLAAAAALIFDPIRDRVHASTRVWLCLPPELDRLPFAALVGRPLDVVRIASLDALEHRPRDRESIAGVALAVGRPSRVKRGRQQGEEVSVLSHLYRDVEVVSRTGQGVLDAWENQPILHLALGPDDLPSAERWTDASIQPQLTFLSAESAEAQGHSLALRRAVLAAGSGLVLANQWAMEERAAAQLAREFYRALADREAPDRALTRAREALKRRPGTSHPYFWAGAILEGTDLRPLALTPSSRWWGKLGPLVVLVTAGLWWVVTRRGQRA